MSPFSPLKVKSPANLGAPLTSSKSSTTATTTMNRIVSPTPEQLTPTPQCHLLARHARDGDHLVLFCVQSAPHPSPQESDWSDEDWGGNSYRVRELERKQQEDILLNSKTDACKRHTHVFQLNIT